MLKEREIQVGDHFADPASPGRVVQVKEILQVGYIVETVQAAEVAVSARAVGKCTEVSEKTFRRFRYVSDKCSFCGWNDTHRSAPSGYHCPVVD